MSEETKVGNELAVKLMPGIGMSREIRETCALIHRHSVTLERLAEEGCNGPGWQNYSDSTLYTLYQHGKATGDFSEHERALARHEKRLKQWQNNLEQRQERLEQRLIALVALLPETEQGPLTIDLVSDPRGCNIIRVPEGSGIRRDDYLGTGVCV